MANQGLDDMPIGLDCTACGQPITVSYMAHGSVRAELISQPMQNLVAAAARRAIALGQCAQLCARCQPPAVPGSSRRLRLHG